MPSPDQLRIISLIVPILLMLFALKRPIFIVIGFMYLYYWSVPYYFPFMVSLKGELIYGLLALLSSIIMMIKKDKSFYQDKIFKYYLFFIGSFILSFIFAWNHRYSWDNAVYHFVKILIIAFGYFANINDKKDINIGIWGIIFMYVYLAYEPMYGFLYNVNASQQMYGEVFIGDVGILSGHVSLANNMNQMIPISAFIIFTFKKKLYRILAALPLLMFLICLAGSKSRGGAIGLIFFLLLAIIFGRKLIKPGPTLYVLIAVLAIFGSVFITTLSRINSSSTEGRLIRIFHGIGMVQKGNIFGVGPGCFILASGRYFGHTMMSHNLYGQLIGDLGIPGTITWFLFIRNILSRLNQLRKRFGRIKDNDNLKAFEFICSGFLISMIIRLFIGLGSHSLYFFYWYVVGMLVIHISIMSNKDENEFNNK